MRLFAILFSLCFCAGCTLPANDVAPAPPAHPLAVVFDIDGTLTTKVHALLSTREGAVAAVQAYADAGFRVIYLSARHPLFQWQIPVWQERHGFPAGEVHVTQTREQRSDHAAFKRGVLAEYREQGWILVAAYGDSSTDFQAYADAGVETDHVFALRREGAPDCEPGAWAQCFANWPEQMQTIGRLVRDRP